MKIDICMDAEQSITPALSTDYLKECFTLVLSCIEQGNAHGVALHPGLTIDWKVTRDEDGAL